MGRIIFVTGTDTSVGKTVLTSLLLSFLAGKGEEVFPLKLFCSGDRTDAETFQKITGSRYDLDAINPWFFEQPVTPLIAARENKRAIHLPEALEQVEKAAQICTILLVEGAGGLLSPLGEHFTALDLMLRTQAEAIIVAPNRLGTLNHSSLVVRELGRSGVEKMKLVLMGQEQPDLSAKSNPALLREWLQPLEVVEIPWFTPQRLDQLRLPKNLLNDSAISPLLGRLLQ